LHYFEVLSEPRYEDFIIKYRYLGKRFAYLGNGYMQVELNEASNPVWYFDVLRKELAMGTKALEVTEC
jgi:hypothetical protein